MKERTRNRLVKETEFRIKIFEFYFFLQNIAFTDPWIVWGHSRSYPNPKTVQYWYTDTTPICHEIEGLKKLAKTCKSAAYRYWNHETFASSDLRKKTTKAGFHGHGGRSTAAVDQELKYVNESQSPSSNILTNRIIFLSTAK